jgi:hypothetical protein
VPAKVNTENQPAGSTLPQMANIQPAGTEPSAPEIPTQPSPSPAENPLQPENAESAEINLNPKTVNGRKPDSPAMKAWKKREEKRLGKIAPNGIYPLNLQPYKALQYRTLAGVSKKKWGAEAVRAREEFGKFLTVEIVARTQLVYAQNVLDQVEKTIAFGASLAAGEEVIEGVATKLPCTAEDRVKAVLAVAEAGKAYMHMSMDTIKLAEIANGKKEGGDEKKPKNLPPSIGVQTTSPDGTVTRVIARSGETQED